MAKIMNGVHIPTTTSIEITEREYQEATFPLRACLVCAE